MAFLMFFFLIWLKTGTIGAKIQKRNET